MVRFLWRRYGRGVDNEVDLVFVHGFRFRERDDGHEI
jgi:hypothetical protein